MHQGLNLVVETATAKDTFGGQESGDVAKRPMTSDHIRRLERDVRY